MDSRLQDCHETNLKRSFPNLEYALLGYDILQGYPLEEGHDPGLTHHIFLADYSGRRQTSDCRYSVPSGFLVIPDVSCVTSFSSKVIKNKLDLSRSLDVSAHVEGGSLPCVACLPHEPGRSHATASGLLDFESAAISWHIEF